MHFLKLKDVAGCLRLLGVFPADTVDEFGRERFMNFNITGHFHGPYPPWYLERAFHRQQNVNLSIIMNKNEHFKVILIFGMCRVITAVVISL